jgi:ribose/xylose/arabinose/galactoside ABC-type transport system permease subunit
MGPAQVKTSAREGPAGKRLRPGQAGLMAALVLMCAALSFAEPVFLTAPNLINLVRQISINGILAVGVTYVLLTGGVDLSLGSVTALAGVVAASFAHAGQYPVAVPVAMGLLTGACCGAVNGVVAAKGRVAPFIATLGMMTVARGMALVVSGGRPVSGLSEAFTRIGGSAVGGVPVPILIFCLVAAASHLFLHNLKPGRYIYAVGGNENAARASGVGVAGIKALAYTICGSSAGLAGVVLASRITTGQPNAGVGYELDAIAAAVIGGTSLSGGVGGVGGTILGALLMGVINNGLDLLNVSSYYQQIVKGLIIVGAVWTDRRQGK